MDNNISFVVKYFSRKTSFVSFLTLSLVVHEHSWEN